MAVAELGDRVEIDEGLSPRMPGGWRWRENRDRPAKPEDLDRSSFSLDLVEPLVEVPSELGGLHALHTHKSVRFESMWNHNKRTFDAEETQSLKQEACNISYL